MAIERQAAPGAQEEDNEEIVGEEGSGGQEGQAGSGEAEDDAALDVGEEQETGGGETLDAEPLTRGETRFQRLSNENSELRRRLTELEQRPSASQQPVQYGESDDQFNSRMQLLPIDQQLEQRQFRSEQRFAQQIHVLKWQTHMQQDKSAFDAQAVSDPLAKRYATEVEAKFNELLSQNQFAPRDSILNYIIGQKVRASRAKETGKQRQRGAQNLQRQQARPTGGRSDVQSTRGRVSEAEARRRRLENMEI